MAFLLDANVFISAKNSHYSFQTVPAFWEWLDAASERGRVFSVERVREEMLAQDDELGDWARERRNPMFLSPDQAALSSLRRVATWANAEPRYTQGAVNTFLAAADYYLVGQAMSTGFTVVTHERPQPQSRK